MKLDRRGFSCFIAFISLSACASGPNIFPGVQFRSRHSATPEFVRSIVKMAEEVGFVEDISGVLVDTEKRHRYVLMRFADQRFPALAIDAYKPDGMTYVAVWEGSVGGSNFSPKAAKIVQEFQNKLHSNFPGEFD